MGERKILTLKRKSQPEKEEKPSRITVRFSRKQIIVEAAHNHSKKEKPVSKIVEKTAQAKTPKNEKSELGSKDSRPIKKPRIKCTLPYSQAVSLIQSYWPSIFIGQKPRLLKINILSDFFRDIERKGLPISHKVLRRCLRSITRSQDYLSRMVTNAPRYNLEGVAEGYVTIQEYEFALERLAKINKC